MLITLLYLQHTMQLGQHTMKTPASTPLKTPIRSRGTKTKGTKAKDTKAKGTKTKDTKAKGTKAKGTKAKGSKTKKQMMRLQKFEDAKALDKTHKIARRQEKDLQDRDRPRKSDAAGK